MNGSRKLAFANFFVKFGIALAALAGIVLFISAGMSIASPQKTIQSVTKFGFTDVEPGGLAFWGCTEDHQCRYFTATNPAGQRVEGIVVCDWFSCAVKL